MGINEMYQVIGSLGFPIAMCIYMIYNSEKTHKRHSEETAKLTELISNNTLALTRLTDKLEMSGVLDEKKEG